MTGAELGAWAVHLYTAAGAVAGLLALRAIVDESYGVAFSWMAAALFLDSTDGTLARRFRVKQVLPHFDGAKLDDIVDYLNYVFVPIVLALSAGLLPEGVAGLAIGSLPLLASAYRFCHAEAKTSDHFFTGFPSYWNVVVFYFYCLRLPPWVGALVVAFLSGMVLAPIRYLYPSRTETARGTTYALAAAWGALVLWLLTRFPEPPRTWTLVSLFFPAYYVLLSFRLHRTTPRPPAAAPGR
jgi:phosphatidylcholine synthase